MINFASFIGLLAILANILHSAAGLSVRTKRNVAVEILTEPDDHCIHHCWAAYAPGNSSTATEVRRMLATVKTNRVASNRAVRQVGAGETFSGNGKIFYDNCQNTREIEKCFKACPESKLQRLAIAENIEGEEYCLPNTGRFIAFADYYDRLQCITNAITTDPRSGNCSYNQTISSATFLNFRRTEEDDRSLIYWNDNKEKNNLECRRVCKRLNDQYRCYKPILIDRCDQDGYDLYVRITKVQVKSQLAMLRELDAIDSNIYECTSFKDLAKPL